MPVANTASSIRVRAATLRELGRVGYGGLTIDGVAKAAGVSRTTIYRRWGSRRDLLLSLLDGLLAPFDEVPRGGGLNAELLGLMQQLGRNLADPSARELASLFMVRDADQEIVRQGSTSDELFIIGRGELEVLVRDEQGDDSLVNVLGEGDYVGEISFLRGVPRTATLRARTRTELYVLRRLDVDQLLASLDAGLLAQQSDVLTQIEATAQARLDDTAARLTARSA